MAAAIVDNFAEGLLKSLDSAEMVSIWETGFGVFGETKSIEKLKEQLDEVRIIVRGLRGELPAAEKKQTSSLTVRGWLDKLGDELLEADDLLDEIRYWKNALTSDGCCNDLVGKLRLLLSSADSLYGVRRAVEITKNLNDSRSKRPGTGYIRERNIVNQTCFGKPARFVGRDDERKRIMELLQVPFLNPSPEPSTPTSSNIVTQTATFSIIALVGLLGSGKTTLVQGVCEDVNVKRHFNPRLWASVSDLLTFEQILTRVLGSKTVERDTSMSTLHQKHEYLSEQISGKKYLLVLDDLSTIDIKVWNTLRALLETGAPGSKILITTRYQNVATTVASTENIRKLGALSDDDAWSLFKSITLAETQEHEQIGKDIVRRCENSPLVITVAANLIAHKTNWQRFGDKNLDVMDMFAQHKNRHLLNELRPCYDQLSPHLKHCVAYCSLFPRDYEFRKQTLIQMWMAQGFLKLQDSNSSSTSNLEDIGEKQFQILLRMSFFEAVKLDALGDIVTCRMRKMFHHLAQYEAGTRCITASGNTKFDNRTLHVSAKFNGSFPNALLTARKLRTLLCHKESDCEAKLSRSICQKIILKLKRLRTLNLSDCGIDVLPENVGDLIHLRYLNLSKNYLLVTIPESVTKLSNLQSMNLNLCQQLKCLPSSMGRLTMLRCLEIDECDSLTCMPVGLQKLTSLQSLNRFVVCVPSEVNNDSGGISVLKDLNSLAGRLKIQLSGQWAEQVQSAQLAKLTEKCNLTDLKIEWRRGASDYTQNCHYYEAFLEGLYPPSGLKLLCIEGYQGRDFPSWAKMGKLPRSLPYLVSVSVEGCKECKHIPLFGDLKHLKYLTLRNMEAVEYMVDKVYNPKETPVQLSAFESLTELTLHSFYNLKGWWKETKVTEKHGLPSFPRLEKLKIWNCPKLISMPLFNKVVEVDFQDVNQKLLEMSSVKVEPNPQDVSQKLPEMSSVNGGTSENTSSKASQIHETLNNFSYDKSSRLVSYGLLQKLTKLRTLKIKSCPQVQSFPTVWDEDIQCLIIDKCDALTSVANGLRRLKSLEMLEISHCDKLWDDIKNFPWGSLTKLKHLTIRGFSQMKAFPEGSEMINAVKTVEVFHIATCSDLTDLPDWIEQMSSLKHLRLEACPNLTKLPQGIDCLRGLDKLEIMECPQLMERCREGGEDRSKIRRHAQVLLHKSWRYGLGNNVERPQETIVPFQFAVNDTTVSFARKDNSTSWEEVTFKSKIKTV